MILESACKAIRPFSDGSAHLAVPPQGIIVRQQAPRWQLKSFNQVEGGFFCKAEPRGNLGQREPSRQIGANEPIFCFQQVEWPPQSLAERAGGGLRELFLADETVEAGFGEVQQRGALLGSQPECPVFSAFFGAPCSERSDGLARQARERRDFFDPMIDCDLRSFI